MFKNQQKEVFYILLFVLFLSFFIIILIYFRQDIALSTKQKLESIISFLMFLYRNRLWRHLQSPFQILFNRVFDLADVFIFQFCRRSCEWRKDCIASFWPAIAMIFLISVLWGLPGFFAAKINFNTKYAFIYPILVILFFLMMFLILALTINYSSSIFPDFSTKMHIITVMQR